MYVAGNTTGEFVPFADQFIKGFVFICIYTAYYTGERLSAVTQHIDIRVYYGFRKRCGASVYKRSAIGFFGTEFFHNIGPDLTSCTQLGNFHKEVGALVKFKNQSLCNLMDSQTAFQHLAHIFYRDCIGIGDFLDAFSAAQ